MHRVRLGSREFAPSKVLCVARNYVAHAAELGNEVPAEMPVFIKPNSALSEILRLPGGRCRYETELVLLIEQDRVCGVGVGLDLTLADVQNRLKEKGLPWELAKAFDGSAVFSDFVPAPAVLSGLRVQLDVNGEPRQDGGVALMIHKPDTILQNLRRSFTLVDGDLVMTGTPQGVGDLVVGDRYEARLLDGDAVLTKRSWTVVA